MQTFLQDLKINEMNRIYRAKRTPPRQQLFPVDVASMCKHDYTGKRLKEYYEK